MEKNKITSFDIQNYLYTLGIHIDKCSLSDQMKYVLKGIIQETYNKNISSYNENLDDLIKKSKEWSLPDGKYNIEDAKYMIKHLELFMNKNKQ